MEWIKSEAVRPVTEILALAGYAENSVSGRAIPERQFIPARDSRNRRVPRLMRRLMPPTSHQLFILISWVVTSLTRQQTPELLRNLTYITGPP